MVEQEVMRGQLPADGDVKVSGTGGGAGGCEREGRLAQVKRMLAGALGGGGARAPGPEADEAAAKQPRKRKERHESIGSSSQERKVVRSSSEERPQADGAAPDHGTGNGAAAYIRRVSSHEDFKKSQPLHERNNIVSDARHFSSPSRASPHRDPKSDFTKEDDVENERRRSSERFSRPLAPRGRRSNFGRKRKTKVFGKSAAPQAPRNDDIYSCKENDSSFLHNNNNNNNNNNNDSGEAPSKTDEPDDVKVDLVSTFLQLQTTERERSPSPVHTPALDLSTLHEQIDCSEPVPSSSSRAFADNTDTLPSQAVASVRMLLSPRNSIILTRRIYMETDVPMPSKNLEATNDPKNPLEQRMRQVTKQINSLKRKIKKFEEEFENQHGYRPSHLDRMEDKAVKKMCSELNKLRKEQKQLKEDPLSAMFSVVNKQNQAVNPGPDSAKDRTAHITDTLVEIEKSLADKRFQNGRTDVIEEMNGEQLMDEKVAVQKALLYFESVYGRPNDKEDRDLMRPLYDRYRLLKRMVVRAGMGKSNLNASDLATIHEHETMNFVSAPSQTGEPEPERASTICGSTDSDTDTSIGENLHAMPLHELLEQQRATNEEKKRLRRSLKEYENEFQTKTGRKLQRDDRLPMEPVYLLYKQAKAKLRLLEALVAKHSQ